MHGMPLPLNFSRGGPYFAALFCVALVAFWPTYLSKAPSASSSYTHLHALTAALWMLMLVAQPLAIQARRWALHRLFGRVSYVLAPLLLISILLLAHSRIRGLEAQRLRRTDLYSVFAGVTGRIVRTLLRTGDIHAAYHRSACALHGVYRADTDRPNRHSSHVPGEPDAELELPMVYIWADRSGVRRAALAGSAQPGRARGIPGHAAGVCHRAVAGVAQSDQCAAVAGICALVCVTSVDLRLKFSCMGNVTAVSKAAMHSSWHRNAG